MEQRYGESNRAGRVDQSKHLCEIELDAIERLPVTRRKYQLIFTLLHEFRHHHQDDHWDLAKVVADKMVPYEIRPSEIDANTWAKQNYATYSDILTFRTTTPNSRFGKLSAAAERAKQNG